MTEEEGLDIVQKPEEQEEEISLQELADFHNSEDGISGMQYGM